MVSSLLKFRTKHNRLKGQDNWSTEKVDDSLTRLRNKGLFVERTKRKLERMVYKDALSAFEKVIPGWRQFVESPIGHKLVYLQGKKPLEIIRDILAAAFAEFVKRIPGEAIPK